MRLASHAVALAAILLARAAHSEAPPTGAELELAWSAPPSCPDRAAVLLRIEHQLARPLRAESARPLSVSALVSHDAAWHLRLAIVSSAGETARSLEADRCDRLADALGLIVALAIDPDPDEQPAAIVASDAPSPAPAAPIENHAANAPASLPVTAFALDSEIPGAEHEPAPVIAPSTRAVHLATGLVTDFGTLPGFGVGVEARAAVTFGAVRLALRGDYWPERSVPSAPGSSAPVGLAIALASAGFQACTMNAHRAWEIGACGAVDVGEMYLASTPMGTNRGAGALWSTAFAEAVLAWRPTRWLSLRVEAGTGFTLATPSFIGMRGVVYQPNFVVGRASLLVEVRFQ